MKIIKDSSIRDKFHKGFKRTRGPSEIIIHGTGGGHSAKGLLRWMMQGERGKLYYRGIALFHYLIDRNGEITEIIDPDLWVYHSSSGKHDERTVGIELMNPYIDNGGYYTQEQYDSLMQLIFDELMERYSIDSIMSHGRAKQKFSGEYKKCPGSAFEWIALEEEMKSRDISYNHKEGLESYWNIHSV